MPLDPFLSGSPDSEWTERAAAIIPGGASTGSKRASALYGDEEATGPTHYVSAGGCRVRTAGGADLVDCTMALGAVTLGYADDVVTQAVIEAASHGSAAGLSHVLEVRVAERLAELIPCAEQVRFLKTGAEGMAAAVRLARASTGRDLVLGCGYFGWLDWWNDAPGIPDGAHADFRAIPFDDVKTLRDTVASAGDALAAVVLEPVIERLPSEEWIAEARRLCSERGAVLIFDEVKTGFRLRPAGFQSYSGVTPDLAVFGKGLANGYPLAAVVGKTDIMDAARSTWISSTLAGETVSLAAANAVLDWHERAEVCEALWEIGDEMRNAVTRAIEACRLDGVRVDGIAPMWLLRFDDEALAGRFVSLAAQEGVLFKRGAYNFSSLAHDEDAIARIESAASEALVRLRDEVNV
ncbi:MAG TPA: aminotransferase class III-fold pyridoxal phosphate-dependent enzyme [Gemmatimonadaceae bacterium]|nr:aminotransferase class III-fold pyridoxal phosphate-dependent enzyme [Gemmatimonadaceae bacterium]